eukprot:CAMPEP_0119005782 /NCGR_PEP_ID=MMETSP1176-20130426/1928_1 /TAXON_ID=265551 /ORGANISM="Synedropsis recta cf, Strain CCMP1620" /LENGTH=139 /DNA_ID=CAMNT_0006957627 /DNA_START=22 /DNA_END=441 /DNA_ORIENTATION=-
MSDADSNPTLQALFEDGNEGFAEEFRDKVGAIHEYFDRDKDGHLNFSELGDLQHKTSGSDLDADQYVMVCKGMGCHPNKGVSVQALRLTYAANGTDLEDDYYKVFPERKKAKKKVDKKKDEKEEDKVYEVGADGVDISE